MLVCLQAAVGGEQPDTQAEQTHDTIGGAAPATVQGTGASSLGISVPIGFHLYVDVLMDHTLLFSADQVTCHALQGKKQHLADPLYHQAYCTIASADVSVSTCSHCDYACPVREQGQGPAMGSSATESLSEKDMDKAAAVRWSDHEWKMQHVSFVDS